MSFTCPTCKAVSHNPNDEREQYCSRCHAFQTPVVVDPDSRRGLAHFLQKQLSRYKEITRQLAVHDPKDPNILTFEHWIKLLESDNLIPPTGQTVYEDKYSQSDPGMRIVYIRDPVRTR